MTTPSTSSPSRRLLLGVALLLGACLTVAHPAEPAEASGKLCTVDAARSYAASLAKKIRIPAPAVVEDAGSAHGAYFTPGTSTISLRPGCTTKTTIAHEFGHYVVDLAAGMSWSEHQLIAKNFTGYRNWLKSSSDAGGFERAAHCIGYQFVKNGTYTKCPHRKARDLAAYVTAMASSRYPA